MIDITIAIAAAAMQARDKDGCPNPGTLAGQILLEEGATCPKWQAEDREKKRRIDALKNKEQALIGKPASEILQKNVREELIKILHDGFTAQFLWPARSSAATYCGFVNAKNRMGSYAGWTIFSATVSLDDQVIIIDVADASSGKSMTQACAREGYPVSPRHM